MHRLFGILVLFCASCIDNSAAALEFSRVEHEGVAYTVVRVDAAHDRLMLFAANIRIENAPLGFAGALDVLKPHKHVLRFAMNAGMFEPDLTPVGLFIDNGVKLGSLELGDGYGNFYLKPNGVFLLTESGPYIVESSEYAGLQEKVTLATQSGPLLLHHGVEHPAFRAASTSRFIRNGVGIDREGKIVFVISESPVNFHQFAMLFRDGLHCADALYFDGTVSSLYAPELGRNDKRAKLGPIIGVIE